MSGTSPPLPPGIPPFGSAPIVDPASGLPTRYFLLWVQQFAAAIAGGGGTSDQALMGALTPRGEGLSPPDVLMPAFPRWPVQEAVAPSVHVPAPDQPQPPLPAQQRIAVMPNGARVMDGFGTPAGVVTGAVGDLFLRRDGGAATTLYVCEAAGMAGWVAK